MEEKKQLDPKELEQQGELKNSYVELEGRRIRLAVPLVLDYQWIGNEAPMHQLLAAWHQAAETDIPMNPRLVGKPGMGKTALAYTAGLVLKQPVYFFQATSDTTPKDVLINPISVKNQDGSSGVEYIASPLVSAMIVGGVCVFDEGNRMQEKGWASLAPLLDSRRYVESVSAGLIVKAHPRFKFVATMNEDISTFDLPDYIKSRLQPSISLDFPDMSEERRIIEVNCPHTPSEIIDLVSAFLREARGSDEDFNVREGILVASYAGKIVAHQVEKGGKGDNAQAVLLAVEQILGVRQARYMKRIIWDEQEAA